MELRQFSVDGLAEFRDLLLIAHINGNGNRSTAPPISIGSLPGVVVQVICRALVSAAYIDKVAEVDGRDCRRGRRSAIPNGLGALELPGRSQSDLALPSLEHSAWCDDVASLNQSG